MRLTFAIVFVIGTITLLISKPIINDILDPNAPSDKKRVKVNNEFSILTTRIGIGYQAQAVLV